MNTEDDFRIRPGKIRSRQNQRAKPFIAQALAAAQRAGGRVSRTGKITSGRGSRFGRGRVASIQANRLITHRSRGAVIKTRVVRHGTRNATLGAHLRYLRREGVTRNGERARMFGPDTDEADVKALTERCEDDRHHFRFIVSPDDALEMADLKSFTRDLMRQAEKDLGTNLDWIGVDHWNTEHPHIHVILRGRTDDGQDLVIARDYIKEGMRNRAQDLITQELGPRTELDIRRSIERQIEAERWTQLDRQLTRNANRHGIIDLAPHPDQKPDEYLAQKVGRLRKLESLGLAHQVGLGQWVMVEGAERTLRELGERGDIIKRMHRALTERGIERSASAYVLAGESLSDPIIGRLIDRGLDDELKSTAYAVIDGTDGRTHHIRFPTLDAAGDGRAGSIVELRRYEDAQGRSRVALAVRSDLDLDAQVKASGATWIDRQLVARDPAPLSSSGFGQEVKAAMESRADHLVTQGLARRQGQQVIYSRNLLETLRRQELDSVATKLAADTGMPFRKSASGEFVGGVYRERLMLASGRFAMLDDGLGFTLVPWTPSIEKHLGRHISGVARGDGGIDWSFGRQRGLGL
ncbi:relaxase/mobilization nuclease domain-containing protein [Pseudorhodoplanes sinuspersici]|uniref:Type VI secretion protein n=1 Tax=Pseudorhodoplanes sinuspersici TaxID=1235591 RepID=A0A1W6ZZD6_9HYPH|nr:VirD2 family relaxase/mobilization nuclease [Pseudorhodoplanes sinuspersici]ARQ02716.1 type VI secretion protein [Pseudorhodoplanes sinuspersici]RKE68176.1 type IV secretory pathway VirD2 relaxase [Pseudorhodoplanes sinuspersici]